VAKITNWSEAPNVLAANFERIAMAEHNQWLPFYYATLATVINSFSQPENMKDKVLDHAQGMLDSAFLLKPDSSECMVLQGFLHIARIMVDPMGRGMEYSQKANEAFETSIKLNPENPRGYYIKGMTVMNTPENFGGGKAMAKPILSTAMAKFESFKPATSLSPNWGKEDCKKQLDNCQ
jgi:hypothetical protein